MSSAKCCPFRLVLNVLRMVPDSNFHFPGTHQLSPHCPRADSRFAPSQWEMLLQWNAVSDSRLAPSQWEILLQWNTISDSRFVPSQWEMSLQWNVVSDSRLAPGPWETTLQCNTISHWLGAYLESALCPQLTVISVQVLIHLKHDHTHTHWQFIFGHFFHAAW